MNLTSHTRIRSKASQTLCITQPNTIHLSYQTLNKAITNCAKQLGGVKNTLFVFNDVPFFLRHRRWK